MATITCDNIRETVRKNKLINKTFKSLHLDSDETLERE